MSNDLDLQKFAVNNPAVQIDKLKRALELLRPIQDAGFGVHSGYRLSRPLAGGRRGKPMARKVNWVKRRLPGQ